MKKKHKKESLEEICHFKQMASNKAIIYGAEEMFKFYVCVL